MNRERVGTVEQKGSAFELAIVFGLTVALPVIYTIAARRFYDFDFGQRRLVTTVFIELVVVTLLWPWLSARGWSFRAILEAPEPKDVLRGVGLAMLAYIASYISTVTWWVFVPEADHVLRTALPSGSATPWAVLLIVVINPLVEECLWLAYGVTALERYGTRFAVVASVALRTSVHLYQGLLAFISVLPLGVVFTVYFARTRRIWPVVVAHMLFDTLALLSVLQR